MLLKKAKHSEMGPDPNQPRKHFDEAGLRDLAASRKVRQMVPPIVRENHDPNKGPKYLIVDGGRRWLADGIAGIEEVDVIVVGDNVTPAEIKRIQLETTFHRADLRGYEKWRGSVDLLALFPSWGNTDLAEHLHIDPSAVTKIMSPSKCIQAVIDALEQDKVTLSQVYAISKVPHEKQAELLEAALAGADRDDIDANRRGIKTQSGRLSRVKIAIKDATAVITASDLGMANVVQYLSEMLREAKKAAPIYDVATFAKMMADKASA